MPTAPTLAKFSRPRLYAVVKRERLFRALDEARAHPIVFIAGPPGAGKSTLVASYVESRRAHGAVVPGRRRRQRPGDVLPLRRPSRPARSVGRGGARKAVGAATLEPRLRRRPRAFTRRFLREFFALFPQGSIFVVDNFHEAAARPTGARRSPTRLVELPAGVNMVILSRAEPPPEMSRLRRVAGDGAARLGVAALHGRRGRGGRRRASARRPPIVEAIHRASDGWAAGLVLMREHLARLTIADANRCATPRRSTTAASRCSRTSPARSSRARGPRTGAR